MDALEFKQRFLPFHKSLYRVAFHLTGEQQDAEDLLQDTYLKLWQKRDMLDEEKQTLNYLATIMRNIFFEQRHAKACDTHVSLEEAVDNDVGQTASQTLEAKDELRRVEDALDSLPAKEGKVFRMHEIDGYSYEEMEKATGLTQTNLRQMVSRTKQKLKVLFFQPKKK